MSIELTQETTDRTQTMTRAELERELETLHGDSFGWALSCCGWDHGEAEEVLQTSYLRVVDGAARFGGRSSFKTWFFGIVRVVAAERRRSRRIRGAAILRFWAREPESAPVPEPWKDSEASETRARLVRCLRQVSPRQRDVLHLVFYQDLTLEEASGVIGLPVGTARKHYDRGKKKLRQLLDGDAR